MSEEQPQLDGTWELKDNSLALCPLRVRGWTHGPEVTDVRQAPCDPENCALGNRPAGSCALLDISLTLRGIHESLSAIAGTWPAPERKP